MNIKKIVKVKNKPLYNIETDQGTFLVIDYLVVDHFLVEGLSVRPELMLEIEDRSFFEMACRRALVYLSYRKRSKKEVEGKLKALKYNNQIIDRVIAKLVNDNYLSDLSYAKAFAADSLKLKGYGRNYICRALKYQKIDDETIRLATEKISISDEIEAAKKIAAKKTNWDNQKIKQYLFGRGFSREAIDSIFKA